MARQLGMYYLLISASAVIWGAQPALVKTAMRELTPVTLTCIRYLLISATLFLLLIWRKRFPLLPPRHCLLSLVLMGFFGVALNNVAQFTGLQYSTVGNATLIASTTPATTAVLAVIMLRERLLPIQWLGILISLCATLFLVCKGDIATLLHLSLNRGDVLFFFSQLGWALYSLIGVRVMQQMSALAATAWAGLFGAGLTLVYGLVMGELAYTSLSPTGAVCLVYIVWGGGVCAMVFWNLGVKIVGASQSAIFLNIMPLVGILTGVLFLSEAFRLEDCFGAAGILFGVYILTHARQIMNWRGRRKKRA